MPYKKLLILALIAVSVPLVGLDLNQYTYTSGFPYGNYTHSSIALGKVISSLLFLVGTIGLIGGLINPKLTLWFGKQNRSRVLAIYSMTLVLAVITLYETRATSKDVSLQERAKIAALHKQLSPGMKTSDILREARSIDPDIKYHYGDTSRYTRSSGFPYDGIPKPALILKYPPFRAQPIIVVEMSTTPSAPDSIAKKIALMDRDRTVKVKPTLTSSDPKVLWGHLEITSESHTFTKCGTGDIVKVDLSEIKEEHFLEIYKSITKKNSQKVFAIISGAITPGKNCKNCQSVDERVKIYSFSVLASEKAQHSECQKRH